jgi:ribonuclease HI
VALFDREALGKPADEGRDPEPFFQVGAFIGQATNNVAEYRALLRGLEAAISAGATAIEVRSDSELLIKQMKGAYQVRNEGLIPLHGRARVLAMKLPTRFVHVPREANRLADRLVNRALDEWERRTKDDRQNGAAQEQTKS